jgi:hypothetical protein
MASYQAQIKDLKNSANILAKGSAAFKKMTSYNPDKPNYTITIWMKGVRVDLADTHCILWINDKTNGEVTLTRMEYVPEKDETKFTALPKDGFLYGNV